MKRELYRLMAPMLITAMTLLPASCVNKKRHVEPTPIAQPTPTAYDIPIDACVTFGDRYDLFNSATEVPIIRDPNGKESCPEGSSALRFVDLELKSIDDTTETPTLTPSPSAVPAYDDVDPTTTPTPYTKSTSTATPTITPTAVDERNYPSDCAGLVQAGWVDQTLMMSTNCGDSTYYRLCGEPGDQRCMFDKQGFEGAALRRVIPWSEGTSLACDDGTTVSVTSSDPAWDACMAMYRWGLGEELPQQIAPETNVILGCIFQGVQDEFTERGFERGRVAINIGRKRPLDRYGLGQGQGLLCELAPQTK